MSKNYSEQAIDILRATNDGDDLDPSHLKLLEIAVNRWLSEAGEVAFGELYANVTKPGGYTRPWFHGIEHLTIDHEGYILWKGREVEHYERPWAYTDKAKEHAEELARRCCHLEATGVKPTTTTAIWQWERYASVSEEADHA